MNLCFSHSYINSRYQVALVTYYDKRQTKDNTECQWHTGSRAAFHHTLTCTDVSTDGF
jgi:hypothetical protein